MKHTTVVTDFKDLRKAIEEVTKNKPAETRYQQQAKKMGYTKDKAVVTEASAFETMQDIVKNKQAQKIKGVMVDMFTASVVIKAYEKVNDSNKKKIEKANLDTLVKLAHKVMGMKEELNLDEGGMSDLLIDIQQGATAKEIARDFKIPLSVAKSFLKDYYGQKKGSRREDVQEGMKLKDVMRKHGRELKKVSRSNSLELSKKAEDDLMTWAMDSGEIRTDDPDEFDQWLDNNLDDLVKGKIKEGKYLKYSDLLLKKSRLIDKEGPNSPTVKAINKEIGKEMKKLGIHEENLQEGTWAIPDSYKKLYNLQVGFLEKKWKASKSNAKRMAKELYSLFGDDGLFDDLLRVETGEDTETTDLRDILKKHLEPFGIKIKPQGARYQITHAPQKWIDNLGADPADESVDETAKRRKSGNKKTTGHGAKKKVVFKTDKQDKLVSLKVHEDEMSRAKEVIALQKKHEREKEAEKDALEKEKEKAKQAADRAKANQANESFVTKSPFKLKSKQYPRAIAIETEGYGTRHAKQENILEACDSFGMITEQELQVEKIEKVLGKQGFLTYNKSELNDIFEDRETQRMILALESVTEETKPTEYDRESITKALEEDLNVEFTKPDGMKAMGPVLKMSGNTYNLKDMHTGKSYTFKYINEDQEVKTFGQVISEARFSAKLIKMAGGIAFDKRYVSGNMTGAVKAIEKLKKGLSDDPKVRELLRIANESFNNEFFKAMNTEDQDAYVKFFQSALKKFNVDSPAQLSKEKKKEFFNYVDKNYKADDEEVKEEKPLNTSIDGRKKNFREKMRKLGYIKAR